MPLAAGTRLGPYEIVAAIGAGGMGEVYKARDTRLERTVAIKVLPPTLAADPEFRARFEREAKSISALNHPHICTLYDVGRLRPDGAPASQGEDMEFLVMEHLEGETLADRLKKGPLSVDQAIDLAGQIADALDKAHRHGIVHRDLKPANVFLVRAIGASGAPHCKLLDFGLAKTVAAPGTIETRLLSTPQAANAGAPLTAQGSLLGTFQYMAPEQIEGAEADARTDIWAFGCVLYEMLTGRRAFEGKSQASLIASILERQPTPIAELQPMSPPALGRLVRTCLEKNPDNRFHTAHDLWLHLQWIEEGGSAAGLPAPVVAGRRRRSQLIVAALIFGVAALAAASAWMLKPAPVATNVIGRFAYPLRDNQRFTRTGRRVVAISPDGTKIAYIANNQIYLRQMRELEAQPIRGTDLDPLDLAFSPDGQSIAFFAPGPGGTLSDSVLKRIEIAGGKPLTLCAAGTPFGASWQGNRIVFSIGSRILSVPDTAGAPETLVSSPEGRTETFTRPQVVQDGKALIYTMRSAGPAPSFDDAQIVVQPLGGGPRRVLVDGGTDGRLLPTGHLTWIREGTLYAQALDLQTLQLTGGPVPILENVRESSAGAAQVAFAENGTMVFAPGTSDQTSDLIWVDRSGHEEPTGAPPLAYAYPRVSPDGTKIVLNTTDGDLDIYVWDIARKTMTKLTSGPDRDAYAVWTPDGRSIVFSSVSTNLSGDLYRRAADGTGSAERLTDSPESEAPQMVLADGRRVLVRSMTGSLVQGELQVWPLEPGGKPEPVFAKPPAAQVSGEVSPPDGRWIAYESPEGSTRPEIHVRPFPATDSGHWQITSGGGSRPMWARSGRELLFQSGIGPNARLMSVPVQTAPSGGPFTYGTAAPVTDLSKYRQGAVGRSYDIFPDGQRFVMLKQVGLDPNERLSLTIVTHWFDELRARVKAK
jgi:serine/threonine-protein kinase